jgi:hypothetical protein
MVNAPTPRRLKKYVTQCLGLERYFQHPGDGRPQPQIPARDLLWVLLLAQLLRECSFLSVEALVHSTAKRGMGVNSSFGDDALGYFTERLDPAPTRKVLAQIVRRAKRNKAFDDCRFIGLAIDGTGAGRSNDGGCCLCRPYRNADKEIVGFRHHLVMISVVGAGLSLPCDVEPYGAGDSEYAAGQRLLRRAVENLGRRFADYVVVDGEFATAPFLHTASDLGLPVVARLKANLPELLAQAEKRFQNQPPTSVFRHGKDHVEIWDAEDFDPWQTLRWQSVRVIRYRQHKPNGEVFDAYWLTNLPQRKVSARSLFRMAKSRWEIENQGFNEAKTHHGLEHICHHHPNSLLIQWLLVFMGLTIERLYRLRYLHRGNHPIRSAIELTRMLWLALSAPAAHDTS